MPQISVIVPVYQVEKYIHRCVESILNQTFFDFELILVDDGSPDNCGAVCDEYAVRDSRVIVIHQQNGGLSAARNAGIDWAIVNSDSQWLTFVDSDDWISPDYLEQLRSAAQQYDVAVSICGYVEAMDASNTQQKSPAGSKVWKTEDFYVEHLVDATVTWGKLYRKVCFRNIRFPAGKIHEDEFTTYRILFELDEIAYIPAPLYYYFTNPGGITKRIWTTKRLDCFQAYAQQVDFFTKTGRTAARKKVISRYLQDLFVHTTLCREANRETLETQKAFRKLARYYIRNFWNEVELDTERKVHLIWLGFPGIAHAYRKTKGVLKGCSKKKQENKF